ncbi:thioesterase family protein [Antrihabitans sp. YC2-6]|uniref:acyl-CoA thioesterase n=1 Tax=Antrihabitans sp. YC2-6 TaxID=2799498 RepID=UPI0018F6392A|nr:thioesterase family protein [Antrihabitans sp. YC2-6]MBJ8348936.1 acyl-CoA thioesterase [Antrihabitans sp. YC2-6]
MTEPTVDERQLTVEDFPILRSVGTRWSDNDVFGHLNNAVHYQVFDTVINGWLSEVTGFPPTDMPALGVVAESGCKYFHEVRFPQTLVVGLAVARLGRSSVTYRLGLFAHEPGESSAAGKAVAAVGRWTHVYVDKSTRRPIDIPEPIRNQLSAVAQRS